MGLWGIESSFHLYPEVFNSFLLGLCKFEEFCTAIVHSLETGGEIGWGSW